MNKVDEPLRKDREYRQVVSCAEICQELCKSLVFTHRGIPGPCLCPVIKNIVTIILTIITIIFQWSGQCEYVCFHNRLLLFCPFRLRVIYPKISFLSRTSLRLSTFKYFESNCQ